MKLGFNDYYPSTTSLPHIATMYGDVVRTPTHSNIGHQDTTIGKLHDHGLATLLLITQAGRTSAQFLELVEATAVRYKANPSVLLELCNEPNLSQFSPTGVSSLSPASAAVLIRRGYGVAKGAGWSRALIAGGPAPVKGWEEYLKAMFKEGLPDALDLAMHPYPRQGVPYLQSVEDQLRFAKKILKRRSSHTRLWATETGVSTSEVDERDQAERLTKIVELCRRLGLSGLTLYRYADGPASEPESWHKHMGVTRADYVPKLAWAALKDAV